jgi:hypothetical protein
MSDERAELDAPSADAPDGKEAKPPKSKPPKPAKSKPAKDKKGAKTSGKKGKKGAAAGDASAEPSVAAHPRAGSHVRRAKGWGGLTGFGIAAYLSMHAGVPTYDAGIRALVAGAAGYLLAWGCSVTVWRHLLVAELRVAAERGKPGHPDRSRGGDGGGSPRRERP